MATIVVKDFKAMGWDDVKVTTKGYSGGVAKYTGSEGAVPVFFTLSTAYIIEDEQGVYHTPDYMALVSDKSVDMFAPSELSGVAQLALIEDGEVFYSDEELERLGINSLEFRQDMEVKLQRLNQLLEKADL